MGNVMQLPEDLAPMVPRNRMPQIDGDEYPGMLVFLGSTGIAFSAGYIDPETCHSHQLVDVARANGMPLKFLERPVLLSKDLCVLDGNHRWYRHLIGKISDMPFIRIELPFFQAVEALETFPKTYEEKS